MSYTKNFSCREFLVSKDYPKLVRDDFIDWDVSARLKLLCESILQPLRDGYKEPIKILSGYRNENLNKKIGGSKNSDHLYGNAADFTMPNKDVDLNWLFIDMFECFTYRQLILYPDQNFIHISCNVPGKKFKNEAFLKYVNSPEYIPFTDTRQKIRPGSVD